MSANELIGIRNTATQDVVVNGLVNLGSVYRRFIEKSKCSCVPTLTSDGTSVTLNRRGIYHITITAIVSAPVAGDVTLQLEENGVVIPGAIATETIATATTEFRTLTIDYFALVDSDLILNCPTTTAKTITLRNIGVASTITNMVINVVKEV